MRRLRSQAVPRSPGRADMAWANFPPPQTFPPPWANTVSFSRTTDGGITWSPPVLVDQPGPFAIDQAPRVRVLPNGTLLAIFARGDLATGLAGIWVARSLDEGQTWQPALLAGAFPLPLDEVFDPETGEQLPQPRFPSSVVAPDGTVYIAYEHSTAADAGQIGVLSSRDGGLTWSSSTLPGVSAFAWEPVIAVDRHGTVGVIWYDLRNDRPGDGMTSADVWFAHSTDGGVSWRQTHVAGPAEVRTARNSRPEQVRRIPRVGRTTQRLRRRLWPRGAAGAERPDGHLLRANRAGRLASITVARRANSSAPSSLGCSGGSRRGRRMAQHPRRILASSQIASAKSSSSCSRPKSPVSPSCESRRAWPSLGSGNVAARPSTWWWTRSRRLRRRFARERYGRERYGRPPRSK